MNKITLLIALLDAMSSEQFQDLQDQIQSVRSKKGPKGPRGFRGEDFDFEENKGEIRNLISSYVDSIQDNLKLTFEDLSEKEKETLSFKFEDLSDDQVEMLKGPKGPRGQRGKPGADGHDGLPGAKGEAGKDGQDGEKGLPGKDGKDFDFKLVKQNVFCFLEDLFDEQKDSLSFKYEDFTEDQLEAFKLKFSDLSFEEKKEIRGPRGLKGQRGRQGIQGETGETGRAGIDGQDGKDGINGVDGIDGVNGRAGRDGYNGVDGQDAPVVKEVKLRKYGKDKFYFEFIYSDNSVVKTNKIKLPLIETFIQSAVAFGSTGGSVSNDTNEPSGFVNRVDSLITFDETTRVFEISPVAPDYTIYTKGTKHVISEVKNVTLPDVSGSYFLYLDQNAELQVITNFDLDLIKIYAYCSYIYYDAIDNKVVVFGDERHGITMDGDTHEYLHTTRGAQLVSGGDIGYTTGNGDIDSDAQINLSNSRIADEDIKVDIVDGDLPNAQFEQRLFPLTYMPIWYREGAIWKTTTQSEFPMLPGVDRVLYNENVLGNWQLTEAPSNNKVCVTYVFASTNINAPVIGILGQDQYQNLTEAQDLASWDKIDFGELPSPEMKLMYVLYYETSSNYGNAVNARILDVDDYRFGTDRSPVSPGSNTITLEQIEQSGATEGQVPVWNDTTGFWEAQDPVDSCIQVADEGVQITDCLKSIDFIGPFVTVENKTTMGDWATLTEVEPSLASYESNNPGHIVVTIDEPDAANIILRNLNCNADVFKGSFVYRDALELVRNGLATSLATSNILGIVEKKVSATVCDVRVTGVTPEHFIGLDVTKEYYLSDTLPGQVQESVPNTTGHIKLKMGQPFSNKEFLIMKGERTVRG